jgi:predicted phosphodiesterase
MPPPRQPASKKPDFCDRSDWPRTQVKSSSSKLKALTSSPCIGLFGGVYSNYLALEALLEDANRRGVERLYCLGDLGAFGPFPDRVCRILRETGITVIQGNYDHSVGNGLADCQCGYTDPRDNYFAKLSYDYTFQHTSGDHKAWMQKLPSETRTQVGPYRVLLCHGSPRKTNEFLWETTTSDAFLNWLSENYDADIIIGTHTGLHWHREASPGKHFINCGAIGRPPNDGQTTVVYTIISLDGVESLNKGFTLSASSTDPHAGNLKVDFVRLPYDHERLAVEMASEGLPEEFVETIRTGWWTTCNEILPAKERARGLY